MFCACLSLPPSPRHHAAPELSVIGAKEDWRSTTVSQIVKKLRNAIDTCLEMVSHLINEPSVEIKTQSETSSMQMIRLTLVG